jgi:uncharacterized Zn-finger protein
VNKTSRKRNNSLSGIRKQQQQQHAVAAAAKSTASFLCEICNAVFNQKIHLTKHSAKHTGIKPFKCNEWFWY